MHKDFINLADFSADSLRSLLQRAIDDKQRLAAGSLPPRLGGKTLAMIFEKPSLRTRVSFETALTQLGGHAIYLTQADIGLGKREPIRDVARVLGRMCDGIMARTFSHVAIEELGRWTPVPVINALSDYSHPCQAMADVMTALEHFQLTPDKLAGRKLAFVGDGNNVARSLAVLCGKLDMRFILACPEGFDLDPELTGSLPEGAYACFHDASEAVRDADVVYTDTWVSMGQEDEKARRLEQFRGFQIDRELLSGAAEGVIVMHCLPAYRGCEISDGAFEAHADTIFEQAANRLHFQRALIDALLGDGGIK